MKGLNKFRPAHGDSFFHKTGTRQKNRFSGQVERSIKEVTQFFPATGMAQPVQGLLLDLPDPFTGNIESLADLFKGVLGFFPNTEPKPNDLFFPFGEGGKHLGDPAGKLTVLNSFIG